jgi:hypothetical protein
MSDIVHHIHTNVMVDLLTPGACNIDESVKICTQRIYEEFIQYHMSLSFAPCR